ncbi:MAG: hypothetical protein WCJ71_09420 [Candidatus Omnitrophota bacterium]
MAKALNRPAVYLRGLQTRFELPVLGEAQYPEAYFAFIQTIVFLRMLNVLEESLRDLWRLEKKLLRLLNLDSIGSKTWYLDACGQTVHPDRRLLLSNFDLGVKLPSGTLQLGLNFESKLPEFFAGSEMGESAIRVLGDYLKLYARIQAGAGAEAVLVRSAARWAKRLK